jgi:hypothetical protein
MCFQIMCFEAYPRSCSRGHQLETPLYGVFLTSMYNPAQTKQLRWTIEACLILHITSYEVLMSLVPHPETSQTRQHGTEAKAASGGRSARLISKGRGEASTFEFMFCSLTQSQHACTTSCRPPSSSFFTQVAL